MVALIDSSECLIFADKIKKFNGGNWKQERIFVITSEHIYNVKKDKVKRRIQLGSLGGISKAMLGSKTEFTLHVPKEYDYRFLSDRRTEIIDIIKRRYAEKFMENLPIYGIDKEKLVEFTTTEKDMKRMVTRFPPSQFRLAAEDIISEKSGPSKATIYESGDAQSDLQ